MRLSILGTGLVADFGSIEEMVRHVEDGLRPGTLPRAPEADTSPLSGHYSPRELRRIDHFTRMCLLAAHRALDVAALESDEDMAIVLASGYGPAHTTFDYLDSIIEFGEGGASPLAFSHSVHNIPAATVAMLLHLTCPSMSLCQADGPVWAGLTASWTWLAEGRARRVLFIAADERTPLLEDVLNRVRPGFLPCEGAVAFVLGAGDKAGYAVLELGVAPEQDARVVDLRCSYGASPVSAAFDLAVAVELAQKTTQPVLVHEGGREPQNMLVEPQDAP